MALTYHLARECLNNVDDAAGRFQIEGGKLSDAKKQPVGTYSIVRRISCGTQAFNTAQVWITLFFGKLPDTKIPPENITLHGSHDFNSGDGLGSVSAASSSFVAQIGKQYKSASSTGTIVIG
ncbi:hypothetical protein [Sphingomonas kyeonggiensis]|uniref:Uncharacterized protein n=1 Tax=Sphingomonas kyeonggiensis TaxID=1268553 RepID=A0A7W6NVN3_9SPHN|nr:hypothetical protein [Sphingomonas kyeonggiensis]MBB4097657.1 hypothetical protein [Sphingomonas kyeonggiensis]